MTGAVKMRSRSAASARSRFEGPEAAPIRRIASSVGAVREPPTPLLECVDRLADSIERGNVDFRGAFVALAARERVRPLPGEADLFLLAFVELERHGDLGRVERG